MSITVPPQVAAWRREKRKELVENRLRLPGSQHQQASATIETHLRKLLGGQPAQTLSAYWPFKAEVDLREFVFHLRSLGWTVALPSVVGKRAPLEFLKWTADGEMDPGVYDIPVPRKRERVTPDVMVLSLVGFDRGNYRLGYGGGYFDITLGAMNPRPLTIGVGFELGRLETIYPAPTDIPMDFIVTEAGIQTRPD